MAYGNLAGLPKVFRFTAANSRAVTTAGLAWAIPFTIKFLQVRNTGANPVRIYFERETFDANGTDGFIELTATGGANDYFEGPVQLKTIQNNLLLRSVTGNTDVVVVAYASA